MPILLRFVSLLIFGFGASAGGLRLCAESARIELKIERLEDGTWKAADPATVFRTGDHLRFLFRSNFSGYLYVLNYGSSGTYEQLFPSFESGAENLIEAGREYVVPATGGGSFRVTGPPGHDTTYWLMSPVVLGTVLQRPPSRRPPKPMTPRCDDAVWRARGECLDASAGPRLIEDPAELPGSFQQVDSLKARDLIVIQNGKTAVVSSPGGRAAPVIYEFRLAHR